MNSKHQKTLAALFSPSLPRGLIFRDVESLLKAVGCGMVEGEGSRVTFVFAGKKWHTHRPHPGKEILPYQIRGVRAYLQIIGVKP